MTRLIAEMKLQETSLISDKVVKEGQALGVEKLITASLTPLKEYYSFSIKIVDANNFRNDAIYTQQIRCGVDQLPEFIAHAVHRMILEYEEK